MKKKGREREVKDKIKAPMELWRKEIGKTAYLSDR
jgi:hypothetical protein